MQGAKKALVTGASEGIGKIFAVKLAAAGFKLTLVARNETKLQTLIRELGDGHRYLKADLAKAGDLESVKKDVEQNRYDLLINNAGVGAYGNFEKIALEEQLRIVQLNCASVVTLSHTFLRQARQGDALINVSSTLGFNGFPFAAVYAASKAFVLSLSESLWVESKERGVYVMALCPGVTATKFHEAAGGKDDNRPPQHITQSAEDVVIEAINALQKRCKPTVVTGAKNRIRGAILSRLLNRKQTISVMGHFGSSLRSKV